MSTSTLAARPPQLRPLNIMRDLGPVASLIELCFGEHLDGEGRRFIQEMRQASRSERFLRWATGVVERVSMPLSGYVWEQDGQVIGNVSLIPFRRRGERIYLIANVAVHPDHRRRGIARALTERAMVHARQRGASALWLHVRADNPGAIALYQKLGFVERLRRTTWQAAPDPSLPAPAAFAIVRRPARIWDEQRAWLERLHPPETDWYRNLSWDLLRPGVAAWLQRLVMEYDLRQWAVLRAGRPEATLSLVAGFGRSQPLWAAFGPMSDPAALTALLIHARRTLVHGGTLALELPEGEAAGAVEAAGFRMHRTLVWMRAPGATTSRPPTYIS